jgi:hypothetical protein
MQNPRKSASLPFPFNRYVGTGPQSIQSAKRPLQLSKLAPPAPSPASPRAGSETEVFEASPLDGFGDQIFPFAGGAARLSET